jgi:sugar/nucleoside kinase (ribokinase family)
MVQVARIIRHTNLFLPNDAEACAISRCTSVAQAFATLAAQVQTVAIKCGAEGAYAQRGDRCRPR